MNNNTAYRDQRAPHELAGALMRLIGDQFFFAPAFIAVFFSSLLTLQVCKRSWYSKQILVASLWMIWTWIACCGQRTGWHAGPHAGHFCQIEAGLEGRCHSKLEAVDSVPIHQLSLCAPAVAGILSLPLFCFVFATQVAYGIPVLLQVLMANIVAVAWNTYLSWASHRQLHSN